jgi:small ligand-binding sensory domain FIST
MKWASATSSDPGLPTALEQATADVEVALGARPDLALVFISESHKRSYAMAAPILADRLGDCCIVGCSASGVIGGGHEWERMPAVSITGAMLPGVELTARWLGAAELPAPADSPLRWQHMLGVTRAANFVEISNKLDEKLENRLENRLLKYPGLLAI